MMPRTKPKNRYKDRRRPPARLVELVMTETPERRRHAAEVVERALDTRIGSPKGRLIQSPLDRLAARETVSPRMHSAGMRLRADFDLGLVGAKDVDSEVVAGIRLGFGPAAVSDAQLDALTNYKHAVRALGVHVGAVVVAVCCYELDVVRIAAQQGNNRSEVMGVLKAGLKTLADHYRLTGKD
jgi:hypothetical protein